MAQGPTQLAGNFEQWLVKHYYTFPSYARAAAWALVGASLGHWWF